VAIEAEKDDTQIGSHCCHGLLATLLAAYADAALVSYNVCV